MKFDFQTIEQENIWKIIEKINLAWCKKNTDDLLNYFHNKMVISTSEMTIIGEGREICIQSYKNFVENANIHDFNVINLRINIINNTAFAVYSYEIKYEKNGTQYDEKGREAFILTNEKDKWLAVWRIILNDK